MAIYTDGKGRTFLSTFRSSVTINEQRVGGLLSIDVSKLPLLVRMFKLTAAFGLISSAILIGYLFREWPSSPYEMVSMGIAAFLPFLFMVTALVSHTSAPRLVEINDTSLCMCERAGSEIFHLASLLSSFSITLLFANMSASAEVKSATDATLLSFVVVFWALYTAFSLRNFARVRNSRSETS